MTTMFKELNLPLPPEVHKELFTESREMGIPPTRFAQSVIEDWLRERMRARRKEEIRQFATEHAGTDLDLDPDLEAAAVKIFSGFMRPNSHLTIDHRDSYHDVIPARPADGDLHTSCHRREWLELRFVRDLPPDHDPGSVLLSLPVGQKLWWVCPKSC